jgi:branched-chain amino acid transport system substrate-binding protein
MAGPLDWTSGPVPNVATVALAGGQWKAGTRHPQDLRVIVKPQHLDMPVDDLRLLA